MNSECPVDAEAAPAAYPMDRRTWLKTVAAAGVSVTVSADGLGVGAAAASAAIGTSTRLRVNGVDHVIEIDPRTTLLDLLRDHLGLPGTKKGCDHGQCGACTVIVEGRRINSCLTLAVMHDGDDVTTIEGLARGDRLHPMQAAFIARDGMQCGYCTPGQICSSVAMLDEVRRGMPSHVTVDLTASSTSLDDAEIRERMSGNLCRCAAYPNIVAAIRDVARRKRA